MKNFILSTTAIAMLAGSPALALTDLSTQSIVAEYANAQKIEIKRGLLTTTIEVYIDGVKTEITYNNATLEEVRRESAVLTVEELTELQREVGEYMSVETDQDDDLDGEDDDMDDDLDDDEDGEDDDDDRRAASGSASGTSDRDDDDDDDDDHRGGRHDDRDDDDDDHDDDDDDDDDHDDD
jgi:hypothetical protein